MFPFESRKSEHYHWILHIQISLGAKCQFKLTILIFWTKFSKKGNLRPKVKKSHFCVRDDDELFCSMVDRRIAFSLISSRDHCQRSSPWRISDTLGAGFEPTQNLISGCVEWSCAAEITTTPRCHWSPLVTARHCAITQTAFMVITYYIKLFRMASDRYNAILMFLLLLVVEKTTIKLVSQKACVINIYSMQGTRRKLFDKI